MVELLEKSLTTDRDGRFQSARAFAQALSRFQMVHKTALGALLDDLFGEDLRAQMNRLQMAMDRVAQAGWGRTAALPPPSSEPGGEAPAAATAKAGRT